MAGLGFMGLWQIQATLTNSIVSSSRFYLAIEFLFIFRIFVHLVYVEKYHLTACTFGLVLACSNVRLRKKKKSSVNVSSIFGNIFPRIEKIVNPFSIFEKIFLKIDNLICGLRVHVGKIQKNISFNYVFLYYETFSK